ncbi:MAG: hypothetical protein RI897_995 [Verrucomicrobiota bacterium]
MPLDVSSTLRALVVETDFPSKRLEPWGAIPILPSVLNILITGANRGIGLALARAFAGCGQRVFAGHRSVTPGPALVSLAGGSGGQVLPIRLDVTEDAGVAAAVEGVRASSGGLDVLVNNAGVLLEGVEASFSDLEASLLERTLAVNVTGVARVTRAFLPLLLESRQLPRLVNISSGAGSLGSKVDSRYFFYGASKAALNHLTIGLAHELGAKGVLVAAISPGWVRTDMGGAGADLSAEESAEAMVRTIEQLSEGQHGCFLDRFGGVGAYRW